jgi:hypothetical protein
LALLLSLSYASREIRIETHLDASFKVILQGAEIYRVDACMSSELCMHVAGRILGEKRVMQDLRGDRMQGRLKHDLAVKPLVLLDFVQVCVVMAAIGSV